MPPWMCPVCRRALSRSDDGRQFLCPSGHSFDIAREGYVNLVVAGRRRSRTAGDSAAMVRARRRFLESGAYSPLTSAVAAEVALLSPSVVLDVGCGEGHHTRSLEAPVVLGIDIAKTAVAAAARADKTTHYAVAGANALPLAPRSVDLALVVFGPVFSGELARVIAPGGHVLAAHPGPEHLSGLRAFVYEHAVPHQLKPPLRNEESLFAKEAVHRLYFEIEITEPQQLLDLFTMTPYYWHAPPGVTAALEEEARLGFRTPVEVVVTRYRRNELAIEASAQA